MSATVAAILKKIAAAFLSSKKGMKTAGGILLGILIIIFIPIFTLLALFDSGQDMILILQQNAQRASQSLGSKPERVAAS